MLSDEAEATVTEFLKSHPELNSKENPRFVDKNRKEALWGQIAKEVKRTIFKIRKWFETQGTRYRKFTKSNKVRAR